MQFGQSVDDGAVHFRRRMGQPQGALCCARPFPSRLAPVGPEGRRLRSRCQRLWQCVTSATGQASALGARVAAAAWEAVGRHDELRAAAVVSEARSAWERQGVHVPRAHAHQLLRPRLTLACGLRERGRCLAAGPCGRGSENELLQLARGSGCACCGAGLGSASAAGIEPEPSAYGDRHALAGGVEAFRVLLATVLGPACGQCRGLPGSAAPVLHFFLASAGGDGHGAGPLMVARAGGHGEGTAGSLPRVLHARLPRPLAAAAILHAAFGRHSRGPFRWHGYSGLTDASRQRAHGGATQARHAGSARVHRQR
mmetsp:Transcript_51823/g.133834  ORF Transcript_51823/g.133834 Transcript_51823/m.133834 type:complete len:312 (+) Transcript_51823:40-975(+)